MYSSITISVNYLRDAMLPWKISCENRRDAAERCKTKQESEDTGSAQSVTSDELCEMELHCRTGIGRRGVENSESVDCLKNTGPWRKGTNKFGILAKPYIRDFARKPFQ